ncbi:MAG: hypothetical protein QXV17_04895 [Candidatus Micrarchaeaceae archaeon]
MFRLFNIKNAASITRGKDKNGRIVIFWQFAPFKQKNPNGMGQIYDWSKKLVLMTSLIESLSFAETIKIAYNSSNYTKCGIIHKDKAINVSVGNNNVIYITAQQGQTKYPIMVTPAMLLSLVDYLIYTSTKYLDALDDMYTNGNNELNNESNNTDDTTFDMM